MKSSYSIWIPSLKSYKRFKEISTNDQRILSKLSDDNLDFIYTLNNMINELCIDDLNVNALNIIDKYIICIYLRVYSIGNSIKLTANCPKCKEDTKTTININSIIEGNIDKLDKNYRQIIKYGKYTATCDIPNIGREYEIIKTLRAKEIESNSIENVYTYYTYAHIKHLDIAGLQIDCNNLDIEDAMQIFSALPMTLVNNIHNKFILPFVEEFQSNVMNINCKTESCDELKLSLNANNINDIIKMLLTDNPVETLKEIYYIAKLGHISAEFTDKLSPIERNLILKFITNDQKEQASDSTPDMPKDTNDFMMPENMMESPSEFDSW